MTVVTLALAQLAMGRDKGENVQRALGVVAEAAAAGAEIVCLPELFASRYFCQVEDEACFGLAEPLGGATAQAIAASAKAHGVTVVTPVFERRAPGLYHNSCIVIGPAGEQLGLYRKMHIPDDPQFHEKYYFAPGDRGFIVVPTAKAQLGPLICWDQWYPEAARLTALLGAEILCYPTAIGWLPEEKQEHGPAQLQAWQTILRSHAVANGVFVACVNRVGFEPRLECAGAGISADPSGRSTPESGIEFWGHSFVADPFGVVLAEAGESETTLLVSCDLERQETVRRVWPFLRDRRIDAYGGLDRRYLDGSAEAPSGGRRRSGEPSDH